MSDLLDRLEAALGGDYRLEHELGGGGMSRVFVAEETRLARRVVVKVLPPELAAGVNAERFKREIQLAASLQHPHIVPVLSAGQAGELFWYTMPFIQGDSLRTKLAREGELPIPEAVRILRDVADALSYAHRLGVVHRDIKPDNVLISGHHAVVTDFGVAKAISASTGESSLTSAGVALGTPAYMAPEQAAADPHVDHRADIYAVGAMAYEMLSGRPPFAEMSPQAVLAAHVTEAPAPVTTRRASVPPALAALVMRCLEKKAADRFQTADELHSQLELLATPSGGTTPTSAVPATAEHPRRAWSRSRLAAGGVVLLAAAGALVAWLVLRSPVASAATRIAVMPFATATGDSELTRLGENLVVTLSANLEGVGDIRTVDGLTVLAQAKRSLSADAAAALARRLNARSFVYGTLVPQQNGLRADFGLYATGSSEALARGSVVVPSHDVAALTDSVTWALLRQIWRSGRAPTPTLAAVTTHSLSALREYLEGEQAIVHSQWKTAADAFARAIEADSTFWLAYWRYRYARGWMLERYGRVDSIAVARYREHRQEIPERERKLIEAGMADGTRAHLDALRDVTERFPDYLPGWMALGDWYFHSGGISGYSVSDTRAALERVVALDSGFTPAWEHLYLLESFERDTAMVTRSLAALARYGYKPREAYVVDVLLWWRGVRLAQDGELPPILRDSISALLAEIASTAYGTFAGIPWFGPSNVDVLQAALRGSVPADRHRPFLAGIALGWATRGSWDSALVAADRYRAEEPGFRSAVAGYRLAAVGAWLGAVTPSAAIERREIAAAATDTNVHSRAELAWVDGLLALARRDRRALAEARAHLRGTDANDAPALDASLRGFDLLLAGDRRGAADSLTALEWATADKPYARSAHPWVLPVDRLIAVDGLLARGDTATAERLLNFSDAGIASPEAIAAIETLHPWTEYRRAGIAAARGRRDEARRRYSTFLLWYDTPPPVHRLWADSARAALARLKN
jgi:TolB-like protein